MRDNPFIRSAAAAAVLLAGAALVAPTPARAEVLVELGPSALVRGSLTPADDVDEFLFQGAEGATLTVVLSAVGKGIDGFDIDLHAPGVPMPLDVEGFSGFRDTGRRVTLRRFALDRNGPYRLAIQATGTGDYSLRLQVAYQRRFTERVAIGAGSEVTGGFGAPLHARVTSIAGPPRGSEAVAQFGQMLGMDLSEAGRTRGGQHLVTVSDIGTDLPFRYAVRNTAATAGEVLIRVSVASPRTRLDRLDLRASVLAAPGGGELALGQVAEAGRQFGFASARDGIAAGAMLVGRDDSVTRPVRLLLTTWATPDLVPDTQAVGPALRLLPAGQAFAQPIELTLPFDTTRLPVGALPTEDIRVLRVSASGAADVLLPDSVAFQEETVTVNVDHGVVFVPITASGAPRPTRGTYGAIGIQYDLIEDDEGGDSRQRHLTSSQAVVGFDADGTGDTLGDYRQIAFSHDALGGGQTESSAFLGVEDAGTWEPAGPAGEIFTRGSFVPEPILMMPCADGSIWISQPQRTSETASTSTVIFLRLPPQRFDLASLAGRYHLGLVEFGAEGRPPGEGVELSLMRAFGTLTLRRAGTYRLVMDAWYVNQDGPVVHTVTDRERIVDTGTIRIDTSEIETYDGTLILESRSGHSLRAYVSESGNVLAATWLDGNNGESVLLGIATRQARIRNRSVLSGPYATGRLRLSPNPWDVPQTGGGAVTIADFAGIASTQSGTIDGPGRVRHRETNTDKEVFHSHQTDAIRVLIAGPDPEFDFPFTLATNGRLTYVRENERHVGGVTADGLFAFRLLDPKRHDGEEFGLEFHVKTVPAQGIKQ